MVMKIPFAVLWNPAENTVQRGCVPLSKSVPSTPFWTRVFPAQPSARMITRTCLLAMCMTVVPLLAMFSHKVPREVREAIRDSVQAVIRRTVPGLNSPTGDAPPDRRGGDAVTTAPPATARAENDGLAGQPELVRQSPPVQGGVTVRLSPGDDERRLAALGAEGIECHRTSTPQAPGSPGSEGSGGLHVASCRLPVDPAGQLQRLFHTQADTPARALSLLRIEVEAWKSRVAMAPGMPVE